MKRFYLLLSFIIATAIAVKSQSSIPNGNFESWKTMSFEGPKYYEKSNSNVEAFYNNYPFNCEKTTDSQKGTYAVKLTTIEESGNMLFGYIINTNPEDDPFNWHGGAPISEKPTGISGYYKYDIAEKDSAIILASFSKNGQNIGLYFYKIFGKQENYTQFSFDFEPELSEIPDSVVFAATSSDAFNEFAVAGSWIQLDNITLKGVSVQPEKLNGDFEMWETISFDMLNNWYAQNGRGQGFVKSTDSYKGDYAVQLTTYAGEEDGFPVARPAMVSTGWYPDNCRDNCQLQGGYPFLNKKDTLAFWYKYAPSSDDSAQVSLAFKQNGNLFMWAGRNLGASANYKYVEIPIDLWQTPDSVIVWIQSSLWQDTAIAYVGSRLIIDEVHFKSAPLTTLVSKSPSTNNIYIYPNPAKETITVRGGNINGTTSVAEIYDMTGAKVKSEHIYSQTQKIDISSLSDGIYMLELRIDNNVIKNKFIKH